MHMLLGFLGADKLFRHLLKIFLSLELDYQVYMYMYHIRLAQSVKCLKAFGKVFENVRLSPNAFGKVFESVWKSV